MNWKRIILGEPIPDKDDPKYKERHERGVAAGRRFAEVSGLCWLSRRLQLFGQSHKVLFLSVIFSVLFLCFGHYVYRLYGVYSADGSRAVAVERVDSVIFQKGGRR